MYVAEDIYERQHHSFKLSMSLAGASLDGVIGLFGGRVEGTWWIC
jgi:hypothetical protein